MNHINKKQTRANKLNEFDAFMSDIRNTFEVCNDYPDISVSYHGFVINNKLNHVLKPFAVNNNGTKELRITVNKKDGKQTQVPVRSLVVKQFGARYGLVTNIVSNLDGDYTNCSLFNFCDRKFKEIDRATMHSKRDLFIARMTMIPDDYIQYRSEIKKSPVTFSSEFDVSYVDSSDNWTDGDWTL